MRKIIPYRAHLIALANHLRKKMTFGEIALWREIKGKKLGVRFSRQISIDRYIVDFYCKDLKLAIEVDGSVHFRPDKEVRDGIRQKRLEALGIRILRFSDTDVKNNLRRVVREIEKEVQKTHPRPLQGGEK